MNCQELDKVESEAKEELQRESPLQLTSIIDCKPPKLNDSSEIVYEQLLTQQKMEKQNSEDEIKLIKDEDSKDQSKSNSNSANDSEDNDNSTC